MNVYAWVLLVALAMASGASALAVGRGSRDVEHLARPAFFVLAIALAWLLRADTVSYGRWLLVGLLAALVAEAFLLGDHRADESRADPATAASRAARHHERPTHLLAATVSLGISAACLAAASLGMPTGDLPGWSRPVAALAAGAAVGYCAYLTVSAREVDVRLRQPFVGYGIALSVLTASGWWSADALVGVGASLLSLSQVAMGAWRRGPSGRFAGALAGYHGAVVMIVMGTLR